MIEIINLKKSFANNTVLNGINVTLESGKIYGFLGMNGAGKSTTINIMSGFMSATSGDVFFDGISIKSNFLEAKELIGFLPENPPLYNEMTVYEYLYFIAQAKGLKRRAANDEVEQKMTLTHCIDVKNKVISTLSKGYRQRVGICGALIGNPKYILLDEPMSGLDPTQIIEIRELLLSLKKKHTIIFSSHILSEVSEVCDSVLILSDGNITVYDPKQKNYQYIVETKSNEDVYLHNTADYTCELLDESAQTKRYRIKSSTDARESLFDNCVKNKIKLLELKEEKNSLEDFFINALYQNNSNEEK